MAVGNRCALLLDEIDLQLHSDPQKNRDKLLRILVEKEGYHRIETNPISEALKHLGKPYKRRALLSEAPRVFNCSSLTAWAYGRCGIRLPRFAISQMYDGPGTRSFEMDFCPGDLLFTDAQTAYWIETPDIRVGHVAMVVSADSVVHAPLDQCVIQESVESFLRSREFRGRLRVIPEDGDLIVLEAPPSNEVDSSEMFLLRILSNL